MFHGAGQLVIDQAWLHDGALIIEIKLQYAIHAREGDHDSAGARQSAAGKSRAGAAPDNGNVVLRGQTNYQRDLFGCGRKNHRAGTALFNRAVILVKKQILGAIQNSSRFQNAFQAANNLLVHYVHEALSPL